MTARPIVPGLHAVVLAAGASRRLGRPKQMVAYGGRALVERAVDAAAALCGSRVTVVLGASSEAVRGVLAGRPLQLVVNEAWSDGMGGSLAAGIASLPADCEGALVLLCDQPRVPPAALERMARTWREQPERLVAARYRDIAGVPAVFPARLFPALRALRGDRGARAVIAQEGIDTVAIEIPEASFDVDDEAAVAMLEHGEPS